VASDGSVYPRRLLSVTPRIDTDDLVDAHGVADLLGLSHRNSVSLYQRRHADMPRPVVELGGGRIKLWLRSEITRWAEKQASRRRTRASRRSSR
jgi:glutathione-regulated potassium-efflux system ancillary protein KefG